MGRVLDSGVGTAVAGATGGMVNRVMAAGTAPRLDSDVPWTPLTKPLADSTVALVSTAGFHLPEDEPFDVDKGKGDPTFRTFPVDVETASLKIAHTHYSHRNVDKDRSVLLPLAHLREAASAGAIRLAPQVFSFGFGGALTDAYIEPPDGTAHQLSRALVEAQVDLALLVPA